MSLLNYTEQAKEDLVCIWEYIAQDDPDQADHWLTRMDGVCAKAADFPQAGRTRDDLCFGIRSVVAGDYIVFYQPLDGGIIVTRVLHGSRDLTEVLKS